MRGVRGWPTVPENNIGIQSPVPPEKSRFHSFAFLFIFSPGRIFLSDRENRVFPTAVLGFDFRKSRFVSAVRYGLSRKTNNCRHRSRLRPVCALILCSTAVTGLNSQIIALPLNPGKYAIKLNRGYGHTIGVVHADRRVA